MRDRYSRRAPPPPRNQGATRVLAGIGLLAIGAILALSAQHLIAGTPSATVVPSAASTPVPSEAAVASDAPTVAPTAAAPLLEAQMPQVVNGTTLSTQSATDATSLSGGPSARALNAGVTNLGKKPTDLEIAVSFDPAGAIDLSILGFRLAGIDPVKLRAVVLDSWLGATTPGVTTSTVTLSGIPATQIRYEAGGAQDYLFVHGDSVFLIETADPALAASAVAAIATSVPAGSSAPSTSPASPVPSP